MRNLPIIIGLSPDGKITNFYNRITRTHVFNSALIFFGSLSIFLFFILIIQEHKHRQIRPDPINQYCLDEGCLFVSTYQLQLMNRTAIENRCQDFYSYACEGWQQTHPIQSIEMERTILGDMIQERNADLQRLLNTPIVRLTSRSWEWKVKTYYHECLDDYARLPDSGKILIGLIQLPHALNGWFLFDHDQIEFRSTNQTVYEQMLFVHGELGANAIFGIHSRFDEINPNLKRLEFFPAGLSMEISDYINNDTISEKRRSIYRLYILEVLALLAQDADITDVNLNNRMSIIADDIIGMEKILAEYYQLSKDQIEKTINLTLEELSKEYSFNFIDYINLIIGNLSQSTPIYITNRSYFQKTFFFLSSINQNLLIARILHNYFRWRLIQTYISDLSYNYIHQYRLFLENYHNYPVHPSNEVYCIQEVIRRFPLAIQRLYTMNRPKNSKTIEIVRNMFDLLKIEFEQFIDEQANWLVDQQTKQIAKEKIRSLTIAIGYANITSDDKQLDRYYEKFTTDDKSHIENAYSYHRFSQWTIYNSLLNPNQFEHWDRFEMQTNEFFDYIELFHRIFLIGNAMHQPLVHFQWPLAMNLGSLGVLLADKLFSTIENSNWWSQSTIKAYNSSRECLANYYKNHIQTEIFVINNGNYSIQLTGQSFSSRTFQQINAIRLAYLTYKKQTRNQRISPKFLGTNLTFEQTFFLAYAQTQCYQRDSLFEYLQTKNGFYNEKLALNTALMHTREFVDVFQCEILFEQCF